MPNLDYLDQWRFVKKDLYECKKEKEYAEVFAQAAHELYDEQTIVSHAVMMLKSISVEFRSELLKWQRNTGKRNQDALERINILDKYIDVVSKVQTDNYALNWNAAQMRKKMSEIIKENEDLRNRLYLTKVPENKLPEQL